MASSPSEGQSGDTTATEERDEFVAVSSDELQQFPPSPSFLSYDLPDIRLVELPAWLQSFAALVGEPDVSEFLAPEAAEPEAAELNGALESTEEPDAVMPVEVQVVEEPASRPIEIQSTELISEDDLPEWLRAIAPDEPQDATQSAGAAHRSGEGSPLSVPTISRAWSSSRDSRSTEESASLFAMVAKQPSQTTYPDQERGKLEHTAHPERLSRVLDFRAEHLNGAHPAATEADTLLASAGVINDLRTRMPVVPVLIVAILIVVLLGGAAVMFLV